MKDKDKVRLQFDFGEKAVQGLDDLKVDLGLTSRVDVVKQALALLRWAVRGHHDGWELVMQRDKEQRIFVLPFTADLPDPDKRRR